MSQFFIADLHFGHNNVINFTNPDGSKCRDFDTVEEMEIRGKATFMEAGGETFTYIPCLNSDNSWITYLNKLVT